jgi:FkbM family methyltransferase
MPACTGVSGLVLFQTATGDNDLVTSSAKLYYGRSIVSLLSKFRRPLKILKLFLYPREFAASPQPQVIELRTPNIQFVVRNRMDIWSVKETFIDRFYTRYGYRIEPGWTVVDIGAAIGEFTIYAALVPETRVLAYEPSTGAAALLEENLRRNRIRNAILERVAIGPELGQLHLDTSGEPLQMATSEQRTFASSELVEAIPLSSVLRRAGGSIDLLKLDCEGAEYDILMKASAAVLDHVYRVVLEYHDPQEIGRHLILAEHLRASGFKVEWWPNVVHSKTLGYLRAHRIDK